MDVTFDRGVIGISRFHWKGREIPIQEVTFHWTDREGQTLWHFFSATDGVNLYELALNTQTLIWKITRVVAGD